MTVLRRALLLALASAIACQPAGAKSSSQSETGDTARFVPARWKSAMVVRGELTGDSIPDAVLVVQGTDPAKRIRNEGLGASVIDTNPLAFARLPHRTGLSRRKAMPAHLALPIRSKMGTSRSSAGW